MTHHILNCMNEGREAEVIWKQITVDSQYPPCKYLWSKVSVTGCRICVGSVRSSGASNEVYLLFRTLLPLNLLA